MLFVPYDSNTKSCLDAYNKKGLGGLYYLFMSMENFHNWMTAVRGRFDESVLLTTFSLDDISNDLNLIEESKEAPDVFGMLAAAVSAVSIVGINPALAPLAAALSATGGMLSMLSVLAK